ncbi:WD repeat-containing protein 75 [Heracleum sosnowskyi]|uniref:WD repeat-containing protein 75 n=1 Tax=Heracleum sosnowskyi TaxID=360622 RepID=A0AAD8H732_9APIA|nr:WD repeat-containing protein 75 [Heracleum sosnowskyi]
MITGGKSYVSSAPAFSNDAKKLLICTGSSVSIFSTSTALQVSELEGHADLVTSVIVVPASSKLLNYCWTSSLDGTIRYWDFSISELVKTITTGLPVHCMVIPSLSSILSKSDEKQPDIFAYVSVDVSQGKEKLPNTLCGQIRKCNLTKARMVGGVTLAETQKPDFVVSSPAGKYIGIRDKRKLRIWEVPTKDLERVFHKKIRLHHTKNITAFAFHPTERIVAAGDATGRILIWRGFGNKAFSVCNKTDGDFMDIDDGRAGVRGDDDADSCTTLHWHSAEVKVLFFSSDGEYLFSGGKEGVLMVWQLDTGKRKFLPRIGSSLLYYTSSGDPSISTISCADNRIHILKMPSMEILKSISGIKLPRSVPEVLKDSCTGFAFNKTSGIAAIRTDNYCIQFYSLLDDREISEVQVCERNYQPVDEVTVIVSLVALSPDGCVMCTVETRLPEDEIGGLVSLKFWVCGPESTNFSLSTIVYEPHRDASISGIAFHPTHPMAVSSSYGGDFKVWVSNNVNKLKDQTLASNGWTCHAVGSYKKKPMTATAFSADGSVLAVAAETVITLWDPKKNVLVAVIGESLEPISKVAFIGKSDYLVSASGGSKPQLSVWSMSNMCMSWSYKLRTEAVTSTVDDSYFAVLGLFPKSSNESTLHDVDGVILLFNVEDPVPVTTWFVRKARGGELAFVHLNPKSIKDDASDSTSTPALLAYVNNDHEFVLFSPHGEQLDEHGISHRENHVVPEETGRVGYESVYGELAEFKTMENSTSPASVLPSGRPWETIFSGSSHNLPSLTKLCSVFLESLLEKRTTDIE